MGLHEKTPEPLRPEGVARDDVLLSANRCPYCHTGVEAAEADHVVCKGCLARHHAACWEEAGRCSACGGTEALVSQATASAPSTQEPATLQRKKLTALLVSALLAVGMTLLLAMAQTTDAPPTPDPAPPAAREDTPPPAGTYELELQQRTGGDVAGIDGLGVWVGDVKATSATEFSLMFGESYAGSLQLRVGETGTALLDGKRFRVHFVRQVQSLFGEDRAVVWITPLD